MNLSRHDGAIAAAIATTADCVATQTAATGEEFAGVLAGVHDRAPAASIIALTSYNSWTGWPELEAMGPDVVAAVTTTIVAALDAWRGVVCDEVEAVGGECVDLFAEFNGPAGTTPAGGLLAGDYTHPSQAGNDLIRDLLLALEN